MRLTHLQLRNWKNFRRIDVPLAGRVFLVGPNASGKSNFFDAIRFLREVAEPGRGFQWAIDHRLGVTKLRSLHARQNPDVVVGVGVDLEGASWWYELHFSQDSQRRPRVRKEIVKRGDETLLDRPNTADQEDAGLLTQTHLEQVSSNRKFRHLAEALADIRYQHIVPQLVREPDRSVGRTRDPFGGDFLEQLARWEKDNGKVYKARMRRIRDALKVALPQLEELKLERDHRGVPHLQGRFAHWRPGAGWQTEDQFSDGSLRLLGLLWAVLDGSAPLLLEEPELSLHPALVRLLPAVIAKASADSERQVLISTHSPELLSDPGIALEEVLLLQPTGEGTAVKRASDRKEIAALIEAGWPMGDAVLPAVAPKRIEQLLLDMDS
jgi:predicted ATPase